METPVGDKRAKVHCWEPEPHARAAIAGSRVGRRRPGGGHHASKSRGGVQARVGEGSPVRVRGAGPGEPNELVPSMADCMRCVCLAEAQAATARRAEERGTGGDLIAKLHLGAHELYKRADQILNENIRDYNRISRKLQAYILLGASVHRARAYRCAAEEAFAASDIGEAIALCDVANKHLARGRDAAGESDRGGEPRRWRRARR